VNFSSLSFELKALLIANLIMLILAVYFLLVVYPKKELSEETKRRPRSFISNAFFREYWYFIMDPFKRKLIQWNVEPNTITLWGLLFSLFAAVAFATGKFGIGGWFVILASTCDVYDGMLARARKISLKSGAFFDSMLDRIGEAAMFAGLLWFFSSDPIWFLLVFIASAASQIVSYGRARAEGLGFDKGGSRGIFQRAERMIIFSIGMAGVPIFELFAPGVLLVKATIFIIALGSVQTAISRTVGIYREIRATEKL